MRLFQHDFVRSRNARSLTILPSLSLIAISLWLHLTQQGKVYEEKLTRIDEFYPDFGTCEDNGGN